jgi:hypothetical protein
MAITKASSNAVAPAAKGDLVVGSATNDSGVLAVGSTDQVLTVDSSTATGLKWAGISAGGMTLLSTTTLSGATTTISGISGAYNRLFGIIYGVTNATSNADFMCKPNNANITSYGGFNTTNTNQNNNDAPWDITVQSQPERTSANNAWSFTIDNYASTATYKPLSWQGLWVNQYAPSGAPRAGMGFGGIKTTSAITSLVFYNTGGNLSTGTVLLYGVK